jgi:hypothetical protein
MQNSVEQKIIDAYDNAFAIFKQKLGGYGPAWIGFSSLGFADQIYIKTHRYITLVRKPDRKIPDPPELELYAIINYCVLFLISRDRQIVCDIFPSPFALFESPSIASQKKLINHYKCEIEKALDLYKLKDHDYGTAWKDLSIQGMADIIFAKTIRLKSMLSAGRTPMDGTDPDGIEATLRDLVVYSAFALVLGNYLN